MFFFGFVGVIPAGFYFN